MNRTVKIGSPPIEVHLRRSARARRYSLRISNADGKVSLTLPNRASERAALDFAYRQEDWLRAALGKRPAAVVPEIGGKVLYLGQEVSLLQGTARSVKAGPEGLFLPGSVETLGARLKGFFKVQARERLAAASHYYASQLGRDICALSLRDTRSRWGSCTADGRLMYSWRLIMAPPEVLEYVAAHEVSHLVQMNHSAEFWAVVEGLMPDYQRHRKWLKANGARLHHFQF
ncbi:MAG: SprT family zinc-dependent metalloprotease [Rhodobacterales bacterium]|jgi:predicted metal-dependent hydrolase|nr:SprT family zinc-dependent metalloprotease [Pseudomonadota bacterium]MDA1287349.1 SprT family zinc-dependent metalloprotease [Pseudomonadota bacterium]NQW13085.1 M48 family metallopeptidase [Rhodobacter sp.]HBN32332.1 M48 family peptidase [Paracoccaceae bacterium]